MSVYTDADSAKIMFNSFSMMGGLIPMKLANRNCTVNGKPLKKIEEELAGLFAEECIQTTHGGFSYFDIDTKMERLTQVVGISNFTIIPIPLPMEEIRYTAYPNAPALIESNKRKNEWRRKNNEAEVELTERELNPHECVTFLEKVITAIVIYSDEGEAAIVKYGYGAGEYGFATTSTGEITNPDNTPDTSFSDGKKRACGALGIGEAQLKQKKKDKKDEQKKGRKEQQATYQKYHIVVTGPFSTIGRNSTKGYKAPAVMKETGEKVVLYVWSDTGVPEVEKAMEIGKFIKSVVNFAPGFTVIGEKKFERNEERVILYGLDVKKGEVA